LTIGIHRAGNPKFEIRGLRNINIFNTGLTVYRRAEILVPGYSNPRKSPGQVLNIHIGMNKTGSTSLQRFLFSNREVLRAQGIKYFDNDEFMFRNAHHRVPNSFLPDLGWLSLDASADERNTPEIIASVLRDELDKNRLRNVVLSSELFSISGTNAGKAARWLNGINRGCQVRIIVYIRNYPDSIS